MAVEINNKTKSKINLELVKKTAEIFLKRFRKEKFDLSIAFVGDEEIKKINKKYRGFNKPTDVLSFCGEGDFFGEIILNYGQIKKQTKEILEVGDKAVEKELIFILVHGLFHLLGYDDETEEDRLKMIRLGSEFIKSVKL